MRSPCSSMIVWPSSVDSFISGPDPFGDIFGPGQAAGVHDLAVDDQTGRGRYAEAGDLRVIGNLFDFYGDSEPIRLGAHHVGGRLAAFTAGAEDFDVFHDRCPSSEQII